MTAPSKAFIINFRFPPAPIGETTTLLRPAVPCLNFVSRKVHFWMFAFLRELEENCVPFWLLGGFRQRTVFTGGQSALLGGRACPEVAFLREFEQICVSFW